MKLFKLLIYGFLIFFLNFKKFCKKNFFSSYGPEASQTTHHALHALGHTTLASFQIYEFGPRSIAGRMARKAGLQIVQGIGTQTETKTTVTQIVTKEKSC